MHFLKSLLSNDTPDYSKEQKLLLGVYKAVRRNLLDIGVEFGYPLGSRKRAFQDSVQEKLQGQFMNDESRKLFLFSDIVLDLYNIQVRMLESQDKKDRNPFLVGSSSMKIKNSYTINSNPDDLKIELNHVVDIIVSEDFPNYDSNLLEYSYAKNAIKDIRSYIEKAVDEGLEPLRALVRDNQKMADLFLQAKEEIQKGKEIQ